MTLKNKSVLITGGTDGLGYQLGKLLLKYGCVVHALGRDLDRMREARHGSHSLKFYTYQCDVSDSKQVEKTVEAIGKVDVVINTAGIWIEGLPQDNSVDEISAAIDINLKGVVYVTRAVLPQMMKRDDGFVVNVISTSGLKGRLNESVYDASKFGVAGFTKSLQEDLKSTNVKVVGVYPGGMKTKLFEKAGKPKTNEDWMDPKKVAEVIVFILERDDTMYMDEVVINKRMTKTSN